MFTSLPRFTFEEYSNIRNKFRAKIVPNMSSEDKAALQKEFDKAVSVAKKSVQLGIEIVAASNTKTFLDNPQQSIDALESSGKRVFSVGEVMLRYGIGTVKSKRHGRGSLCYKKTLAERIISNFTVTATIGDKILTEELSSGNDACEKSRMECSVLETLARQIVKDAKDANENT